MGILSALMAAMMVIGPIIAGLLFEIHDTFPYFAAGLYLSFALLMVLRQRREVSVVSASPEKASP